MVDRRADRHQVIPALHLHAMAGVIKEADRVLADSLAEKAHGLFHLDLRGVFFIDDFKAQVSQCLFHLSSVVDRIR